MIEEGGAENYQAYDSNYPKSVYHMGNITRDYGNKSGTNINNMSYSRGNMSKLSKDSTEQRKNVDKRSDKSKPKTQFSKEKKRDQKKRGKELEEGLLDKKGKNKRRS